MNRSQSGGRKKKPNKPPPSNPLPIKPLASSHQQPSYGNNNNPNNSNNQGSIPKIHSKSQTVMTSSFKTQRQSPVAPPRFNKGDTVIYQGQEAEVINVLNQNQIEITYPKQNYLQRQKATVRSQQLQVYHYKYSVITKYQ